jgi:hypothetical protein
MKLGSTKNMNKTFTSPLRISFHSQPLAAHIMKVICVALLIALAVVSAQATQSVQKQNCAMCEFLVGSAYASNAQADSAAGTELSTRCAMFGAKKDQVWVPIEGG